MNTRDLEAFVAVVETGSVVAASAKLHLTQPAVTRRIQSLERMLGVPLLDRPSKPLKPTMDGRHVYELGRRLLRSIDELRCAVSADAEFNGEFRLGVAPFVADTALAGPLDRLRVVHPAMRLQVVSDWSPALINMVVSGRLDAAAVYMPSDEEVPREIHAERLSEQVYVVVVRRGAKLDGRVKLKQLKGMPWVLNQDGCGFRSLIRRAHERAGLNLDVSVEAMGTDLQLSLVSRGVGLGVVALHGLTASRWRDKVQVLELPELTTKISAWLVHRPPAGKLAAPIGTLRTALVDAYGRERNSKKASSAKRTRATGQD
jgi:DNA-binding transcriptional LysR family regulator